MNENLTEAYFKRLKVAITLGIVPTIENDAFYWDRIFQQDSAPPNF